MGTNSQNSICAKLPEDLVFAVNDRATAEGMSVSELVRHALTAFLFGQISGPEEGYRQARMVAWTLMQRAMKIGMDNVPDTYQGYLEMLETTG